jgi:hypothetical protein
MALEFMRKRVMEGMSNKEIAKEHGVAPKTVERTLTWAEKAGVFVVLEDAIIAEIAPIAVSAIRDALLNGKDVPKGAIEILQGLNIIKKNHPVTAKEVKDSDDLAAYVAKIREKAEIDANSADAELLTAGQNEGHLLEPNSAPRLLPSGPGRDESDEPIPGYSPDAILGFRAERGVDPSDASTRAEHDASDPERVSGGEHDPPEASAAPPGEGSGQDCVPGDEGAGAHRAAPSRSDNHWQIGVDEVSYNNPYYDALLEGRYQPRISVHRTDDDEFEAVYEDINGNRITHRDTSENEAFRRCSDKVVDAIREGTVHPFR